MTSDEYFNLLLAEPAGTFLIAPGMFVFRKVGGAYWEGSSTDGKSTVRMRTIANALADLDASGVWNPWSFS